MRKALGIVNNYFAAFEQPPQIRFATGAHYAQAQAQQFADMGELKARLKGGAA